MINDDTAIKVTNVGKTFKLPHEKQSSVKSVFINMFKRKSYEKQQALKDISFEVKKGEFFGIVGRNGSGKSTLLKLLAGIYSQDQGDIQVNGKLTPFIELGVGFNPELTGRENVFLNGALLGFSRKEVAAMYDDVVGFAELERFMDQKLKNYSSGMQVRLAFSIAIRARSDILLIDEVLAVGDSDFQNKCLEYFRKVKGKKTVIFVTHDMSAVSSYCDKAITLDIGNVVHSGDTPTAIQEYYAQFITNNTQKQSNTKVLYKGKKQWRDNDLTVTLSVNKELLTKCKGFGVALFGEKGDYVFGTNTFLDEYEPVKGRLELTLVSLKKTLLPGSYYFKIGLFGKTDLETIQFYDKQMPFTIDGPRKYHGVANIGHYWR